MVGRESMKPPLRVDGGIELGELGPDESQAAMSERAFGLQLDAAVDLMDGQAGEAELMEHARELKTERGVVWKDIEAPVEVEGRFAEFADAAGGHGRSVVRPEEIRPLPAGCPICVPGGARLLGFEVHALKIGVDP